MGKAKTKIMRVPADPAIREHLTRIIREEIRLRGIVPPVRFGKIKSIAEEAIRKAGDDHEYPEFAMVLTGNEIWRPMVAATPYNRRLLLLPQCLRNNSSCNGVFDEMGLVCNGCHSCSLDYVVTKAERLGYASLIAEGTTVAIGLVEEGSVDAVIGVSCMTTLEKSFEKVKRSALPVIGIPLLCEGCSETSVDEKWLLREINRQTPDPHYKPLSVSLLKEKVNGFFNAGNLQLLFKDKDDPTMEMAIRSVLAGGQRIRPLLAALSYVAYAPDPDDDLTGRLAVIIECFHKASLIHDDIEDRDDFRYETETLHRKEGIPVAINVGDYLMGKGYELLSQMQLSPEQKVACLQLVASSHVALARGQGYDLLSERDKILYSTEELLKIYALKTGAAVEVALLLGAIAGGASPAELETLRTFARLFGTAYQVRDDLEEFQSSGDFLHWSDFPYLVASLREHLNGHTTNDSLLASSFEEIRAGIEKEDVSGKTARLVTSLVEEAYSALDRLENLRLKLSLYGVTGRIFSRYDPS
jgi:geranylgeranyl diphosphate synthase, type II